MVESTRGYMAPSKTVEWGTPQGLFDKLDAEFHFTLDPCATHENAKCVKHYTKKENGLIQSWANERVFMNCPYGDVIKKWTEKAYAETHSYFGNYAEIVVGLLPARTDTRWFHEYIYHKAEIRFLKGRLKFEADGMPQGPSTFPSMIVIWRQVTKTKED